MTLEPVMMNHTEFYVWRDESMTGTYDACRERVFIRLLETKLNISHVTVSLRLGTILLDDEGKVVYFAGDRRYFKFLQGTSPC